MKFGWSVAGAGDVNGDGYDDVLVGAPYYSSKYDYVGAAYVYMGSPSGLSRTAAWSGVGEEYGALYGYRVASAGDVNGDGFDDILVGAPYDTGTSPGYGRVYLYPGSWSGPSTVPAWRVVADQPLSELGFALASAGDVNGDGYDDVILAEDAYDLPKDDEGRVLLYLGSAQGLATKPAWVTEGDQPLEHYGVSVASAGDVNGDEYGDVIVGAYWYKDTIARQGRVFVYLGSSLGLENTASWYAESDQSGSDYGFSSASAGDVNGDGFPEVIVGARAYDHGSTDEGRAFLYSGSKTGPSPTFSWDDEGEQANALYGQPVASAGDVDGDGYGDVLVGSFRYDNGQTDEGRVYLYLGSGMGLMTEPAWWVESDQDGAYLGDSAASAGDVNGDGLSDVIVGASFYGADGRTKVGRAYLYLGHEDGRPGTPDADGDGDGVGDALDNCPEVPNADQTDADHNGHGDVCNDDPEETPPPGDDDASAPGGDDDASTQAGDDDATAPGGDDDASVPPGDDDASAPVGDDDASAPPGDDDVTAPAGDDDATAPVGDDDSSISSGDDDSPSPGDGGGWGCTCSQGTAQAPPARGFAGALVLALVAWRRTRRRRIAGPTR
jgi:MYXO-CTERM domain-containing protein